jgi:hypothetical protein
MKITTEERVSIQHELTTVKQFLKDYQENNWHIIEEALPKWFKNFIRFCSKYGIKKHYVSKDGSKMTRTSTDFISDLEALIKPEIVTPSMLQNKLNSQQKENDK